MLAWGIFLGYNTSMMKQKFAVKYGSRLQLFFIYEAARQFAENVGGELMTISE